MSMRGVSHVAIGVRDMERSLRFYRDLLGMRITFDTVEEVGGMPTIFRDSQRRKRRTVHLRWEAEPYSTFIVLSEQPDSSLREPTRLDEIGIHHFSLWVSDLRAICERLQASGVPIFLPPTAVDTAAYGEEPGGQVLSTVFQDPDGVILQLDERVKEKG